MPQPRLFNQHQASKRLRLKKILEKRRGEKPVLRVLSLCPPHACAHMCIHTCTFMSTYTQVCTHTHTQKERKLKAQTKRCHHMPYLHQISFLRFSCLSPQISILLRPIFVVTLYSYLENFNRNTYIYVCYVNAIK